MCEEGILGSEHLVWTLVSPVLSLGSSVSLDTWSASSSAASKEWNHEEEEIKRKPLISCRGWKRG